MRVLDVTTSTPSKFNSIHPSVECLHNTNWQAYLLVQLVVANNNTVDNLHFPNTPLSIWCACIGLQEAAETNCTVWVIPQMVARIAFLPHLTHVRNQNFGPTSCRAHTYYIRSRIVVPLNSSLPSFFFEYVFPDRDGLQYNMLGCGGEAGKYVTTTKYCMETLYFLSKCNSQMLNEIGNMAGV